MPGVVVNTGVRVGGVGAETSPSSTFFVVGTAMRGRTSAPVVVRSMQDFEKEYGTYGADYTLHQHVRTFFEEGGVRAVVQRVVGSDAEAGSVNLQDADSDTCITLTAANAGDWSSDVSATVVVDGGEFSISVTLDGVEVLSGAGLASPAEAITLINNSLPHLLVATPGASSNNPDNQTEPLAAGDDDLAGLADSDFVNALELFSEDYGTGAVAAPEKYGSTIWAGLKSHAVEYRRIAICAFDPDASASQAVSSASAYGGANLSAKSAGGHMAFYWPSLTVPDETGGTMDISPESFVAAVRARNIVANGGPWKPAAGVSSAARFVVGLSNNGAVTKVPKSVGNDLDAGRVNAIRVIDGQIRIYGARSASADEVNWRYITYRDTVNQIATNCEKTLEQFVFSPIDSRKNLFGAVSSSLVSILEAVKDLGGLYAMVDALGTQVDRGYSVEVSDALNPIADLADGKIAARIGVRVAGVVDLITLTITKSSLTAAL
jgi:hypothetical protein